MTISLLRELPELKIVVVHPPDEEGDALVSHLRRVGCMVSMAWPMPATVPPNVDVLFLLVEGESRQATEALLKSMPRPEPTVIAIVNYEDPTTLQLVLESAAFAVVQKPIKPFGLLAHLVTARSLWAERQAMLKENRKLRRKITSDQAMSRAKTILMASKGISEGEAYQAIRAQAMAKRLSMEQIASSIINMETLLHPSP
ncbi:MULTISPECIES: ANTAR domain-containing response regulator [unclassified Variovorax]|jgi:response regulator NasT|uniref:ANTAR domain-containing response regulator n=1 Tax=unclassified Variovorax TaxID=663243 RepID=UPI0008E1BF37|nr:ANTAR domain-containing protein [Variovorax sp. PDC80]SFO84063.1 Two-component response regulator, AmiR/NasT family, consists of REC and RNA-binding antiterminator (ANTAR) domains [Variovorax sp. PDC80]